MYPAVYLTTVFRFVLGIHGVAKIHRIRLFTIPSSEDIPIPLCKI